MSKNAIVVTMSPGYLYSLNATMNAMAEVGTDCDFEVVFGIGEGRQKFEKYMELSQNAFLFKVIWTDRESIKSRYLMNWFSYKYQRALDIWDKYDSICIIDGDAFFYTNLNELFNRCINEKKFVLDASPRYTSNRHKWVLGHPESGEWSKPWWYYVDTPVFFNTKVEKHRKVMEEWISLHSQKPLPGMAPESDHPCGCLDRALCKYLASFDEVIEISGWSWLCELGVSMYEMEHKDGKLYWVSGPGAGKQLCSIHNRWWMPGRAIADLRGGTNDLFLKNMNLEKTLMDKYNNMKLTEYVDYYIKGEIKRGFD